MSIEEFKQWYERVKTTDSFDEHIAFIKGLLASQEPQVVRYHYELLRDRANRDLYLRLRAKFAERKQTGEAFLVQQLTREDDPAMVADILQMLGHMGSAHARDLALRYASATDERIRHVATIVLGWVGTVADMKTVLTSLMVTDPDPLIRAHAATALRQVWYRKPTAKPAAVEALKRALATEKDPEALRCIIVTLQTLLKKRFGLRESDEEGTIEGDVLAARDKALRALSKNGKS